jgi:hypothetical protein
LFIFASINIIKMDSVLTSQKIQPKSQMGYGDGQVQRTSPERLHSVEEFITKLEQAIAEKI